MSAIQRVRQSLAILQIAKDYKHTPAEGMCLDKDFKLVDISRVVKEKKVAIAKIVQHKKDEEKARIERIYKPQNKEKLRLFESLADDYGVANRMYEKQLREECRVFIENYHATIKSRIFRTDKTMFGINKQTLSQMVNYGVAASFGTYKKMVAFNEAFNKTTLPTASKPISRNQFHIKQTQPSRFRYMQIFGNGDLDHGNELFIQYTHRLQDEVRMINKIEEGNLIELMKAMDFRMESFIGACNSPIPSDKRQVANMRAIIKKYRGLKK